MSKSTIDFEDCSIGACSPPTGMTAMRRSKMTFWEAHKLITEARSRDLPLKVTAHMCTLIDQALQAAQQHSLRTQHAMLASYYYETLPGPIGGTEVVIVEEDHQANVRRVEGAWQFVAQVDGALDAYQQGLRDGAVRIADEIKEHRVVFFELSREEHAYFILTTALTDFITEQRAGAQADEVGGPSLHRDLADAAELMLDRIEAANNGEGQADVAVWF